MVSQKSVFWQALVLTIIVFLLGVGLGYILERGRLNEIQEETFKIQTDWEDSRLANIYFQNLNPQYCDSAIKQNLLFGDRIYQQGLKIDEYDQAAPLTEKKIDTERKRYALFKTEFLLNSISLKEKCNANYDILIYFFVSNPTIEVSSAQNVQANILRDLKEDLGSKLMLIPLPTDLDISIINLLTEAHNIISYPAILINDVMKFEGTTSKQELKNALQEA